jgi:hypothetical protein
MYGVRTSTILLPSQPGQRERLRGVDSSVAARRFYRGVLGGRQVWPADSRKGVRSLWFLVGDALIEVDPARRVAPETVELAVDAPNDLAEKCWNAGYTVRLRDADVDDSCSAFLITDPFGRTIALTQRVTRQSVDAIAG